MEEYNLFQDASNAETPASAGGMSVEGQAFLLVTAAGLCTMIGASVVFFPALANLAQPHILCMALSFAAGIMLYVSLVDIYGKSVDGFAEGFEEGDASIYACLSFFGGCCIMLVLDKVVDALLVWDNKRAAKRGSARLINANIHAEDGAEIVKMRQDFVGKVAHQGHMEDGSLKQSTDESKASEAGVDDLGKDTPMTQRTETCVTEESIFTEESSDSAERDERDQLSFMGWAMAAALLMHVNVLGTGTAHNDSAGVECVEQVMETTMAPEKSADDLEKGSPMAQKAETVVTEEESLDKDKSFDTTLGEDHQKLTHMGWAMAAAIALHNFPEGMVTYLAYTQDNAVGVALAIGIAIHNIPEGLCVAMPLYYATGRRLYSFMWGTLSGLTEPLGALLVWAVLHNGLSGTVNGILFGLVGGMMTVISIDELLPTALRSASNPKIVTYGVLVGMFFIASSLMLFSA